MYHKILMKEEYTNKINMYMFENERKNIITADTVIYTRYRSLLDYH